MGDWYKTGGTFTLRDGAGAHTYRVWDAAVSRVTDAGTTHLVVCVHAQVEEVGGDAPSFGPSLTAVLDPAEPGPHGLPRWELGPPAGRPVPILGTVDFHLIQRLSVEWLADGLGKVQLRFDGTAEPFAFDGRVCAADLGTHPRDGGRWLDRHRERQPEPAWPDGHDLTRDGWHRTDQLRRLVRAVFPPAVGVRSVQPSPPGLLERLGLRRPPPPPPIRLGPLRRSVVRGVTDRQTMLMLAALVELYLADANPDGSPDEFRAAARTMERFADGVPTAEDRERCGRPFGRTMFVGAESLLANLLPDGFRDHLAWAHMPADLMPQMLVQRLFPTRCRAGCDLVRCLFGDPFAPAAIAPGWRTPAVVALAGGIYEARDFAALPVLADALEDAGCADQAILSHLREPGRHARGCFVLDAIKE